MIKLGFIFGAIAACAQSINLPVVYESPKETSKQFHDATYNAGWDIHMSPYAGGEDLLFAHRCVERIEGWTISKSPISQSRALQAKIWRLSELTTVWLPLNYLAIVGQHEVFGHGFRLRDIGKSRCKVHGYEIGVPIPYGPGGGATYYNIKNSFTSSDATSVAMAGVESTAIMALLAKLKWLESHRVDPRQTALYLFGQYDLTLYIGSTKTLDDKELDGHDINTYVKTLNITYTKSQLTTSFLRNISWINLADPFTYYSLYGWFRYIVSGKETRIPMIPICGYKYLPGVRLGLTPFGPEYFLENFLLKGHNPYYFYLKVGNHSENNYFGLGFFAPTVWSRGRWQIGSRFDAWYQPKFLSEQGRIPLEEVDLDSPPSRADPLYSYSQQGKKIGGVSASILVACKLWGPSGLNLEFGWKSPGFLPGYSLKAAPTVRTYLNLVF